MSWINMESGGRLRSFWTSASDGSELSASFHFTPLEIAPGTHWQWGWVGPRDGLNFFGKETNLLPLPGVEPQLVGCPIRSSLLCSEHFRALHEARLYLKNIKRGHTLICPPPLPPPPPPGPIKILIAPETSAIARLCWSAVMHNVLPTTSQSI